MGLVFLFFRNLLQDDTVSKLRRTVALPKSQKHEVSELLASVAFDMVEFSEKTSIGGNLWFSFLAYRLVSDENPLGRTCEMSRRPVGSINEIAAYELWTLRRAFLTVNDIANSDVSGGGFPALSSYVPSQRTSNAINDNMARKVTVLGEKILNAASAQELVESLIDFYVENGSGIFALNRAFRWNKHEELQPVADPDTQKLDSLIGYEAQKKELRANTESFLSGLSANNALLFGDSGTGKSSSIRALLNEPGFAERGLRMIEIRQDQFRDIPDILDLIRNRNYKFILFMDDLSFEEFETEYKYLKAIIEGGIERKPRNAIIYATSNRRNLVKEVWNDRKKSNDDVHGGDTMQEKLSLADRFGITIWYGPVGKTGYVDMVVAMAQEVGISTPVDELEKLALRWEIDKGSFTGRTARQFVQSLMSGNIK